MNGSSMKRRSGPWRNAAASISFWRVPFDRSRQIVPRASSRSKNATHRSNASWRGGRAPPAPSRPKRAEEAARLDVQVHARERGDGPVLLHEAVRLDRLHAPHDFGA